MTIEFAYDKRLVLQALRYHFISQMEIRIMIILVNVFAFSSAALFYFQKITPLAFLVGSFLWFMLMISFWFLLPGAVYKKASTFRDRFTMHFGDDEFTVGNERGSRAWPWTSVTKFIETPHFFHLYFDRRSFFLVPKAAFGSSDRVHDMRLLLRDKVRDRKRS